MSSLVSDHTGGAARLLHCMYILVCVFLLVTGFNPAWYGHYGFLEDEELVRQASEKHLQHAPFGWYSEKDYGTGLKMVHVTCRHVMPSVGSMESPV